MNSEGSHRGCKPMNRKLTLSAPTEKMWDAQQMHLLVASYPRSNAEAVGGCRTVIVRPFVLAARAISSYPDDAELPSGSCSPRPVDPGAEVSSRPLKLSSVLSAWQHALFQATQTVPRCPREIVRLVLSIQEQRFPREAQTSPKYVAHSIASALAISSPTACSTTKPTASPTTSRTASPTASQAASPTASPAASLISSGQRCCR